MDVLAKRIQRAELSLARSGQTVICPLPDRMQELRRLKVELIGIRRAQLKLVKQLEEALEAVDRTLLTE